MNAPEGLATHKALERLNARLMGAHMDSLASTLNLRITNPIVSISAPLLLALVSLAACWAPARRSAKIDPATALRAE